MSVSMGLSSGDHCQQMAFGKTLAQRFCGKVCGGEASRTEWFLSREKLSLALVEEREVRFSSEQRSTSRVIV